MRVLVSGASGMIGTELRRQLSDGGHEVVRLVRGQPRDESEISWAPAARIVDFRVLDGVDAVINLSGASLSRLPWTGGYKKQIIDSRVHATNTVTDAMRMANTPPKILLNASAVGFYGDQGSTLLTEAAPIGTGFLAEVVKAWEDAAHLAPDGTRVVTFRTGLVLGHGGAMRPLLPLARLGLSGPLGSGTQYWPWISLRDEAAAIVHLLTSTLTGPVNLAGPSPATANDLMSTLAEQLGRPFRLRVPERLISGTLRDAGQELLLASQRVSSKLLVDDGFVFRDQIVDQAVAELLAR
jgi:uncharacterized protein (TIGR01777 family)